MGLISFPVVVVVIERKTCALCDGSRLEAFAKLGHREVASCEACGYLFAERFDTAELERAYVEDYYASKDDGRIQSWVAENAGVWEGLCETLARHAPAPQALLDIGAGTGGFLLEYHRRNPKVRLFAIESSANARDSLKERLADVQFLSEDARDLSAGGERFDVVTLLQTLEHLVEPERVCAEIQKSLRPGGVLLVTVPNRRSYAVAMKGTDEPECFGNPTHLQFFERRTLERMLDQAGFARAQRVAGFGGSSVSSPPLQLAQFVLRVAGRSKELRYLAWK